MPITGTEFNSWVGQAKPGEKIIYFEGNSWKHGFRAIGPVAYAAFKQGRVYLHLGRAKRPGRKLSQLVYIAVRRKT